MKDFETLINETRNAMDMEELEAAADLFHYGIEKGYYTKRQVDQFNDTYWKVKNKYLAYEVAKKVKGNTFVIISMVTSAPVSIKEDIDELTKYVSERMKALKGKIGKI